MKILKNNQGNVSVLAIFIMFGVTLGIIILTYHYGVFIVRRQAQNITDSAAIAAAQEMRYHYEIVMKDHVQDEIDEMYEEISDEIAACYASYDSDETPDCPTTEELVEARLGSTHELTIKLNNSSFELDEDWDLVVLHSYFSSYFTPFKNGDILYETSINKSSQIRNALDTVINKNNGEPSDFKLFFPYEGEPNLYVEGSKELLLREVVDGSLDVPARGAVGFTTDFDIDVSSKVRITLN